MIVMMVHSRGTFIMSEGYLLPQELNYCGYLCPGFIFRDHILLNFFTGDRSLYSLYSFRIVTSIIIFTLNIILHDK